MVLGHLQFGSESLPENVTPPCRVIRQTVDRGQPPLRCLPGLAR